MRDRLHNEDRRPLRSRAMDQLRDLFDGMSNEPMIVIPLMVSFLIMAFCLHRLFVTNIPLGEFVQNSILAGAAMGWVLGCLMIVICFLYPDRGTTRHRRQAELRLWNSYGADSICVV